MSTRQPGRHIGCVSHGIVNQMISDGFTLAEIARSVGRDSSLIGQIRDGIKPARNLETALRAAWQGTPAPPPPRRTRKDGKPARIRARNTRKGKRRSRTPDSPTQTPPQSKDTTPQQPQSSPVTIKNTALPSGKFVTIKTTKTAHADFKEAVSKEMHGAAQGNQNVSISIRVNSGQRMTAGKKGGLSPNYISSLMQKHDNGVNAAGGAVAANPSYDDMGDPDGIADRCDADISEVELFYWGD